MKKSVIAAVLMLLAISVVIASGQPQRGPRAGDRMGMRHQQMMDALQLTDAQEAQFKKLHLDLERKQTQLHSRIQLARLDMREAYQADKVDRAAIEKSIKQVSDLQSQLKMNFVDFWFSANNILTPEQQKVWKDHIGGMGPRFGAGFGDRMPMGSGRMMHRPTMDQDPD